MKYDPAKYHRRSIRLKNYDYTSAGAYFVTICTKGRECVLDDPVVAGIILAVWHALPDWFPTIELDEFVIMPNHVHLIVWLLPPEEVGATLAGALGTDAPERAGARPAPTDTNDVGATLAVALGTDARDADAPEWAGARPAPTEMGDAVGATLAVAHNMEWAIPQPETINLHPSLGDVMGAFKSLVFTVYLDWIESHEPERRAKFWQRNYYEHVIRSDPELDAIRRYIQNNPPHWNEDRDNPDNVRHLPLPAKVEEYLEDIQLLIQE